MNEIKLVVFDLDGTLIKENSWFKLNTAFGVSKEEDDSMFKDYLSGKLSYGDWMEKLTSIYKERGLANYELAKTTLLDFVLEAEVKETVEYLKEQGYQLAIISGSFALLVDAVADELNIENRIANTKLIFSDSGEFIAMESGGEEKYAKLGYLESLCQDLEIGLGQCVCVSAGGNDSEIFKATGRGITIGENPQGLESWKQITSWSELKTVL